LKNMFFNSFKIVFTMLFAFGFVGGRVWTESHDVLGGLRAEIAVTLLPGALLVAVAVLRSCERD